MRAALRGYSANRVAVGATCVLGALVAVCLVVPVLSPYDGTEVELEYGWERSSWSHPLGTDFYGRDLAVRMALGGQVSLFVASAALVLIFLLGLTYGMLAGLAGGKIDALMMRALDALFALPRFPILVCILVLVGIRSNVFTLIGTLAIVNWMTTARLVRGEVVRLKETEYVRASRLLGGRWRHIALRHIAPNTVGILLVAVFLELPGLVLTEALVSALGLGINPPTATWGTIAQLGLESNHLSNVALASAAVAVFAICATLIADGLQDALDPRRARTTTGPRSSEAGSEP